MWRRHGFRPQIYDITQSDEHDLLSEGGFKYLLSLILRPLFLLGLCVCGMIEIDWNMFEYDWILFSRCGMWLYVMVCAIQFGLSACRLLPNAAVLLGPPCSLFVYLSSSLHKRSILGAWGDVRIKSVRMANQIVKNTAAWLQCYMAWW